METTTTIHEQFDELTLIRVFEVEVMDIRSKSKEYIIFNIGIDNNNFIATHIGLTMEDENSNKISFVSVEIDNDFSLDENLQGLYEQCMNAIIGSDFYTLID